MARDYNNQHRAVYGGFVHDFGYVNFSGTGSTLEIDTILSKISCIDGLSACQTTAGDPIVLGNENLYIDETVSSGGIAVSGGAVTLTRVAEQVEHGITLGTDDFTAGELVERVLFLTPRALTLSKVIVANGGSPWVGSPALDMGTTGGGPVENISGQAITITAHATTTITTFVSSSVAADANIKVVTQGATSALPSGTRITAYATVPLTSGMKVWYHFIGID